MHEIITIQLGNRANHLATHFWNTQESYQYLPLPSFSSSTPSSAFSTTAPIINHDIHFRQGIASNGSGSGSGSTETYLPRTVIYDLKGGFGALRRGDVGVGADDGDGGGGGVWSGPQTIHTLSPIAPSPYHLSLANPSTASTTTTAPAISLTSTTLSPSTVRYWSDYTHTYYHPRSMIQLNDYTLSSSILPFETHAAGDELFDSLDKEHDLLDRDLRLWAEECDQMQGVQMFTGVDDAWGGFAGRYTERIRDDFGKVGLWVWGVEAGGGEERRDKKLLRTSNAARSLHDISAHASMYIPLAIPKRLPDYVGLDRPSGWHTSALLETAVESMMLPSRMHDGQKRRTLNDLETALNVNGNQRIARLQCSVFDPDTLEDQRTAKVKTLKTDKRVANAGFNALIGEGEERGNTQDLDVDLFPRTMSSLIQEKGREKKVSHIFGQISSYRGNFDPSNKSDDNDDEGNTRKRRRTAGLPMMEKFYTSLPHPLLPTYPPIFPTFCAPITSVSVHSSLSTATQIATQVKAMKQIVSKMVGLDEREALSNGLGEIVEAYEEGWSGGSDSDDD